MTPERKLLCFDQWPECDKIAWHRAVKPAAWYADGGAGCRWSDGSKKTIRYGYARWLGHLTSSDPAALGLAPGNRVTEERIKAYIAALQGSITPAGTHNYIKHLADAIRVMAPDRDWTWLRELGLRLEKLVVPTNKRPRMVSIHALVRLGVDLMLDVDEVVDIDTNKGLKHAILYRDGLMIALLACRPHRRRNFANIRIGINLRKFPTGYRLVFEEHETKTHNRLDHPIPDFLVPYLERYLQYYRTKFPRAEQHDYLWASAKNGPLRGEGIYDRITHHTEKAFGRSVNPHLFRDCVATTIALEDPEHAHIAADLLGHSTFEFTQRHYIQAQTREA